MFYHLHTGGEKKQRGEDQYIEYVYIQQERVAEWGAVMCVCIVCERILSGTAAEKIMEDQGTVFSDKLSSGKLQLYHRK